MNSQAHPLKIGLFVLAGLGIAVGGILILGAGRLFVHRVPVIVNFDSSVNGLNVGSPVKFKGVPVGQVESIQISFDETSTRQFIPVILELDEGRVVSATGREIDLEDRVFMQTQVDNGMRASLELDSFISGRLYVQLDFYEDAPPPESLDQAGPYFEIPTFSTGLPEFVQSLTQTDLAGLALDLRTLVKSMNQMIAELQVGTIRQELVETLDTMQTVLQSPDITNTLHSLHLAADEVRSFLESSEPNIDQLSDNLTRFTDESSQTLQQLRITLREVQRTVSPDSPLVASLEETLRNLTETSRSVRRVADTLHRTPSVLVTGRAPSPEDNPSTPTP